MSRFTPVGCLVVLFAWAGCGAPSGETPVRPALALSVVASAQHAIVAPEVPRRSEAKVSTTAVRTVAPEDVEMGTASWYGKRFQGRLTASGERFDIAALTAAHRTLPFGTWARVTAADRSVVVCINDRGPMSRSRIIDLSRAAAERLDMIRAGLKRVEVEVLVRGKGGRCATSRPPRTAGAPNR